MLVDSVQDYGIFMLDPEGRIASWNAGAEQITGFSAEEVLGEHFSIFYTPEDLERCHPQHELESAIREGRYKEEGWRVRKDGSRFWTSVVITALRGEDGELVGFAKVTRDLSERRQAEEAVRRREQRFHSLIAATAQIVWVTDPRGMLLADQTDWGAFTGQNVEEYEGRGWLAAIHPEDRSRTADAWSAAVESRSLYKVEHRVRRHDGVYRTFSVRGVPVLESDGQIREWVGTHTDVTERNRAQDERDFLEEASRLLASSVDYETTLANTAQLAVSRIADWCAVDLLEEGRVQRVATAHADPAKAPIAAELRHYPFDPARQEGKAQAIRNGESALYPEISEALLESVSRDPEHRRLLESLGMRSAMVVPLISRGEILGTITFICIDSEHRYGPRDLKLAEELARRASIAVDHARLFRETEEARVTSEHQAMELEFQMEELQNQRTQLEESQLELEMANEELNQANRELTAAEAHYRRLVESSPYGVFVLDTNGVFTELNPAGARILDRSADEVLGGHFGELIATEDLETAQQAFRQILAGSAGPLEVELSTTVRSGEPRLVAVVITAVRENGQITGVHGVSRDITEERRMQVSLRESEASYRSLFESLTELVYIQDTDGRFLEVNEAVLRRYGYSRDEIIGATPDLIVDSDRTDVASVEQHFRRACEGEPRQFEFWARTSDGTIFPKEVSLARGRYFGQDVVIAVARDVTERKQAEEREQELVREKTIRAEAEAANRAKSEFLSRMSHELRTPLNAILGFGQLLEMDVKSAENEESVGQILRAGQHLLALVDEVLDIARIEAGQMSLSVEPVSVAAVLKETVDLVHLTAAKQEITLRAEVAASSELFVLSDQQRLKQVLLNLLSNAIKYNRRQGTVLLSCEAVGENRLRISVRDTGYGITAQKLERLFTPFDRLGADQTGVEGTGLGLALSKGLVEAMGGQLGVDSVEGEGSRFWVELPLAVKPELVEPVRRDVALQIPHQAVPQTHTVLLVEDNLANVRLMERVFQRRPQVKLLTAMQGSLGLDLVRQHRPDLVLLDLNLPDVSGEKVLLQLRSDPGLRSIPVVMISGDAIPSKMQRMLDLGAHAYITKPFDIQEILGLLDEHLRLKAS